MWIFCGFCKHQGEEGAGLFSVSDGSDRRCPDYGKPVAQEGVTMSPLSAEDVETAEADARSGSDGGGESGDE